MRVLVATEGFGGTLDGPAAARAVAEGWCRRAPGDQLTLAPMAGGDVGFVGALQAALGGTLDALTVTGPDGGAVPAALLRTGPVAYVEAADACGPDLPAGDPERATSRGVGEALLAAVRGGARRVVVGVGRSATTDGGAGLLGALGAVADRPLDAGPEGLAGVERVDLAPARRAVEGVELVLATDVPTVLLGMFGTSNTHGRDRGLDDAARLRVDARLDAWVGALLGRSPAERRPADEAGAGAGGGLGLALGVLGATRTSALGLVADAARLPVLAGEHDVVLTGGAAYDFSSRLGSVPYTVAEIAAEALRPCVVLAGQVLVGSREMRAMGVEAAYSVADVVGEDAAARDPAGALADLAARVARTWSF